MTTAEDDAVTSKLNEVLHSAGEGVDTFVVAAAQTMLVSAEWESPPAA